MLKFNIDYQYQMRFKLIYLSHFYSSLRFRYWGALTRSAFPHVKINDIF